MAVKAFVVKDKKILLLKRSESESSPGVWSVPGGKLEPAENPFNGLRREVAEETALEIEILNPLRIHHFDMEGRVITLISFHCDYAGGEVTLNEEHDEFKWASIEEASKKVPEYYVEDLNALKKFL